MYKLKNKSTQLIYALLLLLVFPIAHAASQSGNMQLLFDQALLGEANYRDDIVKEALYRLELIAPNDPKVMVIRIWLSLQQKNLNLAKRQLEKLKELAADSESYRKAKINVSLFEPKGQKKLQRARLLAMTGHAPEAKKVFDELFHGTAPTLRLNLEYWSLVALIPAEKQSAYRNLNRIYLRLKSRNLIDKNVKAKSWQSSLKKTLARLLVSQADSAFKAGNLVTAKEKYLRAYDLNPENDLAMVGLGDIDLAKNNFKAAEAAYNKALKLDPDGILAVYGLAGIYKRQSPERALRYIKSLSSFKQDKLNDLKRSLQSSILQKQAESYAKRKQWSMALQKYRQAYNLTPDDVWLTYHIAESLSELGRSEQGIALFRKFVAKQSNNPQIVYAYAMYLSSIDRDKQAIARLNMLPRRLWDNDIRTLARRLNRELVMDYAQNLRAKGYKDQANAYLLKQPPSIPIWLVLGDWAQEDGGYDLAMTYYRKVQAVEPGNFDAKLGIIETFVAEGKKKEARYLLQQIKWSTLVNQSINFQRRVAKAWISLKDLPTANRIFQRLKSLVYKQGPDDTGALVLRDAALLEVKLLKPELARDDFAHAMVYSGITSTLPTDNDTYTFLTRNHSDDDWMKRSVRSYAASLYRQQEHRTTLEEDFWYLSGSPGTSKLFALDTILQTSMPLYDGRWYVRGDVVTLDAGRFITTNGIHFDDFGTCNINGCSTELDQKQTGFSFASGWANDNWAVALGSTPFGYDIVNWVGLLSYSNSFNHIGWTLSALRIPLTNSLLSFAGAKDPNTGIIWGGVVATGANLALSYDRGEAYGLWANLEFSQLTGKNVLSNQRLRLMDGIYYRLINEPNRQLSVGLTNLIWHYQNDQNGYTLGYGGYYSPQQYFSIGMPVDYRQRTDNWSYQFGGNITWSRDRTDGGLLYPLPNLSPIIAGQNSIITGSSDSGLSYSLLALVERRLSSHFTLGAVFDYQYSRNFTPSHASIYLRYSLEGWQGDLDMPIRPLVPYGPYY